MRFAIDEIPIAIVQEVVVELAHVIAFPALSSTEYETDPPPVVVGAVQATTTTDLL